MSSPERSRSSRPFIAGSGSYSGSWLNEPKLTTHLNRGEPAIANAFLFEVDGIEIGIFREGSGLEVSMATVEIPEGGQNQYVFKAPGRLTWPNIVLRHGLTRSDALFEWMTSVSGDGLSAAHNKVARHTAAISAVSAVGARLRSWNLKDALPVKWTGPEFGSDKKETTLEEQLEIAHHGFSSKTFDSTSDT